MEANSSQHKALFRYATHLIVRKMQETSYPVYLNLKIPWLAKVFYWSFLACLIVLLLLGIYMLPSEHSPDEMKAAYFVLTTTEFEQKVFVLALFGTPFFFVLYRLSRYRRQALLILLPGKIEIDNYTIVTSYSVDEITHIACNDAMDSDGFPKGKLTIDLKDKTKKVTSVTLIDYSQSDQLMDTLLMLF
jgi:hypothetical protein